MSLNPSLSKNRLDNYSGTQPGRLRKSGTWTVIGSGRPYVWTRKPLLVHSGQEAAAAAVGAICVASANV